MVPSAWARFNLNLTLSPLRCSCRDVTKVLRNGNTLVTTDVSRVAAQRTWAKEGPVKTQSRIDTVKRGQNLSAGTIPVGGVAWAPHRGIQRVEVSTDGGGTWNDARLADQLDDDTWRQYVYEWDAKPGDYTLAVRATDGTGETQMAKETPPHPSGASGYHTMDVTVA